MKHIKQFLQILCTKIHSLTSPQVSGSKKNHHLDIQLNEGEVNNLIHV
jgi:hypothetical protein